MTTLDTHKTVRADGSRVVYGARLVHKSDSTEWRYRGIHSVPLTERGTGMILAQRAGTADDPKRFPGSTFGVRVVSIDVEEIAHGGSPLEARDPAQVRMDHLRDDRDSAFVDAAAADPELSDGEPPVAAFGVRVVPVGPDVEDTVHGPIEKAAIQRRPPIKSLLHSGAADPPDSAYSEAAAADPELSDGEPPVAVDADFAAAADAFAENTRAHFAEYKRPTSADEFATFIRDRIIELTDALPERTATVASGPVVTHVTDEVVYVIEVHTVKNGPV